MASIVILFTSHSTYFFNVSQIKKTIPHFLCLTSIWQTFCPLKMGGGGGSAFLSKVVLACFFLCHFGKNLGPNPPLVIVATARFQACGFRRKSLWFTGIYFQESMQKDTSHSCLESNGTSANNDQFISLLSVGLT